MLNKTIWSYWNGNIPLTVKMCIKSWKKYANDWEINIVTAEDIRSDKYLIIKPKNYNKLSETTKSDVIRLSLLYEYGGLWMDASVLLTEDINWLKSYTRYNFFGFQLKGKKYIENWFLFSNKPHSKYILKWVNTLNEILNTVPMSSHIAYTKRCTSRDNYFMMYQAFCYLTNTNKEFKNNYLNTPFIRKKTLYNVFKPLSRHEKLVKFTKWTRNVYSYCKYPYVYFYIFVFVLIIIFFVVLLSKKRVG